MIQTAEDYFKAKAVPVPTKSVGSPVASPTKTASASPSKITSAEDYFSQKAPATEPKSKITSAEDYFKTNPPAPAKPSTVSKAIGAVKNYAQESADTVVPFGNAILHPIDALNHVAKFFTDAETAGVQKAGEGLASLFMDQGAANKVAGGAKLLVGAGEAALSPLSGIFKTASKIPGAKQVADTINLVPTVISKASDFTIGKAIDVVPDYLLSEESKKIIKEPIQNLLSLTAQLVLGGEIIEKITDFAKENPGKEITPEETQKIVDKAKVDTADHPEMKKLEVTQLPKFQTAEDYFAEKANPPEPYIPEEKLPVIEMGSKAKSDLPTIQTEPKQSNKVGDFVYEPIKEPKASPISPKVIVPKETVETPSLETQKKQVIEGQKSPIEPVRAPSTASMPEKITAGKASKVAKSIEAKTVEKSLTGNFSELAGYDPITIKEQAQKVSNLINEGGRERIQSILTEKEKLPDDIRGGTFIKAVEDYATQNGDGQLLSDLAKSRLTSETSIHAQELRTLAERSPESPVKAIREIAKEREEASKRRSGKEANKTKKETVNQIKNEIKKSATKQTWGEFVESIKC